MVNVMLSPDSNTTPVNVQPTKKYERKFFWMIQIQHLLLFIGIEPEQLNPDYVSFKYNTCYCSSEQKQTISYIFFNSNTTLVTVQPGDA